MRVSIFAWSLCIFVHIEKLLFTLQSKYDYAPSAVSLSAAEERHGQRYIARSGCTTACNAVCKELLVVANTVHAYEKSIHGLDLMSLFWRPVGQQFVGVIVSHIRRQRVTEEGAPVLLSDLNEYLNVRQLFFIPLRMLNRVSLQVFAIMEAPETIDMLYCLKEMCAIFSAKPEAVAKVSSS